MAQNAPAGADYDSRAPWLSDPGPLYEREYDPDDYPDDFDDFDEGELTDCSDNYYQ